MGHLQALATPLSLRWMAAIEHGKTRSPPPGTAARSYWQYVSLRETRSVMSARN